MKGQLVLRQPRVYVPETTGQTASEVVSIAVSVAGGVASCIGAGGSYVKGGAVELGGIG